MEKQYEQIRKFLDRISLSKIGMFVKYIIIKDRELHPNDRIYLIESRTSEDSVFITFRIYTETNDEYEDKFNDDVNDDVFQMEIFYNELIERTDIVQQIRKNKIDNFTKEI
jgi:hypothetical protein